MSAITKMTVSKNSKDGSDVDISLQVEIGNGRTITIRANPKTKKVGCEAVYDQSVEQMEKVREAVALAMEMANWEIFVYEREYCKTS